MKSLKVAKWRKDEWRMMKVEGWRMIISSCWGVSVTDWWKDKQTDICECRVTFATEKEETS